MVLPKVPRGTPAPVEKEVNLLLADIRGFTGISEAWPGLQVANLLNVYFNHMIPVITRYGGVVDKLMGDAILAVFECGEESRASALNTLSAAVDMQLAMDAVNEYSTSLGMGTLYMGIGINTGRVISAVLGNKDYREHTVIGDAVNLVSRVEAFTLRGQVLMSENTYSIVKDDITVGDINRIKVKGKNRELVLYELVSVLRPRLLLLPERDPRRFPRVKISFPVTYQIVKNKIVLDYIHDALVLDVSYGGFSVFTRHRPELFLDIKFSMLLPLVSPEFVDIYAKVLHIKDHEDGFAIGVEITSISDEGKKLLKSLVDINI
jgi:adenylate cyclase